MKTHRLYGIQASRSGASMLGPAQALVKWTRKCSKCNSRIRFGDCPEGIHEVHESKTMAYLTKHRASVAAGRLNMRMSNPNLYYLPVLVRKSSCS